MRKNSQDIKAATQNVAIAKEQIRQAQGGVWPTLGYEISGSNSDQDQITGVTPSKEVSTAAVSLTQPLYTGGKLTQGIKLAKLNLEAAMEDERKTRQVLIHQSCNFRSKWSWTQRRYWGKLIKIGPS